MTLQKEYYSIIEATEHLGCKTNDIVHLGSIGKISLHVYLDLRCFQFTDDKVSLRTGDKGFYCIGTDDLIDHELLHSEEPKMSVKGFVFPKDNKYRELSACEMFPHQTPTYSFDLSRIIIFKEDFDSLLATDNGISQPAQAQAHPKEIKSLLTIIIAMATYAFNYDRREKRSEIVKEITSEAERLGLSISDDTVRKWLKEAAQLQEM